MSFASALIDKMQQAGSSEHLDNWDHYRFGPEGWLRGLYGQLRRATKILGVGPYRWVNRVHPKQWDRWRELLPGLEWLYARLDDDISRQRLVDVVAYRLMGHRAVKLPLNTPEYWSQLRALEGLKQSEGSVDLGFRGWRLDRFDLSSLGYPIVLNTRVPNILAQFVLEQYACERIAVAARPGDVVIDGGGCFGDTALYFAHRCGETGRVYSFEFVRSNLELFRRNLLHNTQLAERIEICAHPLWSRSDQPFFVLDQGPASRVLTEPAPGSESVRVESLSIDDLVERRSLDRVDFIKMDIEGAEFEALQGAEKTIRRFQPQLAICVYHSPADFVRLARKIDELNANYQLALDHFTIHSDETVLFARRG